MQWEHTREGRVGTWRDFMTKKSKKSKGGSLALGGYKPPRNLQTGGRATLAEWEVLTGSIGVRCWGCVGWQSALGVCAWKLSARVLGVILCVLLL
jgi:hypothetical protein